MSGMGSSVSVLSDEVQKISQLASLPAVADSVADIGDDSRTLAIAILAEARKIALAAAIPGVGGSLADPVLIANRSLPVTFQSSLVVFCPGAAWTEILAATAAESTLVIIRYGSQGLAAGDAYLEIGTGAVGAEVSRITLRAVAGAACTDPELIPLFWRLPAGTRISARIFNVATSVQVIIGY